MVAFADIGIDLHLGEIGRDQETALGSGKLDADCLPRRLHSVTTTVPLTGRKINIGIFEIDQGAASSRSSAWRCKYQSFIISDLRNRLIVVISGVICGIF